MQIIDKLLSSLKQNRRAYEIIVVIFLFTLGLWQVWMKPVWLTYRYGSEMRTILVNYIKTVHSLDVHQNPRLLATVATGDYLDFLERITCQDCPSTIPITVNVNIERLTVLDYDKNSAEVSARIEDAWVQLDFQTQEIEGSCQATASEGVYHLIKEDGHWKVTGGHGFRSDTWTPLKELREKVCPSNLILDQ
jgi:hypothetical protein